MIVFNRIIMIIMICNVMEILVDFLRVGLKFYMIFIFKNGRVLLCLIWDWLKLLGEMRFVLKCILVVNLFNRKCYGVK